MKIVSVMWASYLPLLKRGADNLGVELISFSNKQLNEETDQIECFAASAREADLLLLYRTSEAYWDELEPIVAELKAHVPIVMVGSDPSSWAGSNVAPEVLVESSRYLLLNGPANMENLLRYLLATVLDVDIDFGEPEELPWQGICNPALGQLHADVQAYLNDYRASLDFEPTAYVGLLFSRTSWVTANLEVERELIRAFEQRGLGVIPAFMYSMKDKNLGNLSGVEVIENYMLADGQPLVSGIVKLTGFFLGSSRGGIREGESTAGAEFMQRLNIPLFSPIINYRQNAEQWRENPAGLGSAVAWSIAMPEFEGVLEPIVVGANRSGSAEREEGYEAIAERCRKLAGRVAGWLRLKAKPNHQKKVAIILHNNPCVSAEASVGGGAHLDTLESVARILKRLETEGYQITPPENGQTMIQDIMARKAVSEFRFTTVDEIVEKGGDLDQLEKDRYLEWFNELPEKTRLRMNEAWGEAPGELKDGIPPAMLYEGRILITGTSFGNAVVCVQPKRGCAGARCDGQVCKILHDPDVPPPHQYLATYRWLERVFGADLIMHVGTHGNLEFLPGKGAGLTESCLPDICIGEMPHLYIYNSDNPPEGIIAKRRSYATLIDHMQTVMVPGELYGDLEKTEQLLDEWTKYSTTEPGKAHTLSHLIMDQVKTLQLLDGELNHTNFAARVPEIHEQLEMLKKTSVPLGMHIFGQLPEGERFAEFVYAVMRFSVDKGSLRGMLAEILARQAGVDQAKLMDEVEAVARLACLAYVNEAKPLILSLADCSLNVADVAALATLENDIEMLVANMRASDEMRALLNGFDGGYIAPGPSGLITRGRPDILPTGRNFYGLDPKRVPTPGAWAVGCQLADKTIEKYLVEEGQYPENIAFYWQCTDIMWSDGEGMAQMMYLLGAKPVWAPGGRLKGYEILSLEELKRPRIDLTVRISGITRDNFSETVEIMDSLVQEVVRLDEPLELNFVRKHTLEKLAEAGGAQDEAAIRRATYRFFASQPGTYQAGTQLAVYASAWKTEQDLADVFLYWNGYAYGKDLYGEPAHQDLKKSLKTVDLSFNKTVTDEYDLTGCCCYFGTHGGLINAAQVESGRQIKNYYGDTREQSAIGVRTLNEELRRVARGKILNPKWIEGMKEHGYKGAGDISKRVGRLYGWQATSKAVDGAIFDDVARTFLMDEENRQFFEEHNPWALEEIARRLIEARERKLWQPAADVSEQLNDTYLEIEGFIEERLSDVKGEFQGGSIDIITAGEVAGWQAKMKEVLG